MGEVTREELAAMTDQELLAYEREHHGEVASSRVVYESGLISGTGVS
jgi:hypothetical protein